MTGPATVDRLLTPAKSMASAAADVSSIADALGIG